MRYRRPRPLLALTLAGNAVVPVRATYRYDWNDCKSNIQKLLNGTLDEVNGVDKSSLLSYYLYTGAVTGLSPSYPRENLLTVTYEGCRAVCQDPIAFYEPETAISLVSNWVFPMNIVLSLPYESLHEGKFHITLIAILNWLGSPQTALTATIFNFRQLRQSHRRVQRDVNTHISHLLCAAFFVLCSINQFDVDPKVLQGLRKDDPSVATDEPTRMLKALVYGIFRPLSDDKTPDGRSPAPDVELTRQLLVQLAFQLRMLRRRGVIPMLANLGMFLVAFVFSVVLAFAELGDDKNSPFSLAFGLLVTWVPLLVVFTVVDRNPISSERSAELLARWLYNVEAVKNWAASQTNQHHRRDSNPATPEEVATLSEQISVRPTSLVPKVETIVDSVELPERSVRWWTTTTKVPCELRVGEFIGQGRRIQYCGIPHAFLAATDEVDLSEATKAELADHAKTIAKQLRGGKPLAWYVVAVTSFLLVWTAVLSAFVVSFSAPVVGLGCRSLTYLIFGTCSSVSWLIQFRKRPRRLLMYASYVFNALAIMALLTVVLYQVTGLASNCFCKSSVINSPLLGGYIDFEDYLFYRDRFNVTPYWILGAVVGGMVPTIAFVVAVFWWVKCRQIWKANERTRKYDRYVVKACTAWLQ